MMTSSLLALAISGFTQTGFPVSISPEVRSEPATGRLIVSLIREGSSIRPEAEPNEAPFWDDPQPMFGVDTDKLLPGTEVMLADGAASFPAPASTLAPGSYRAQARLIVNRDNSDWKKSEDNLYSDVVTFNVPESGGEWVAPVLVLNHAVRPKACTPPKGVEVFRTRSPLLSAWRKRDVILLASVTLPRNYDPSKHYPAIYAIPGFGGDHTDQSFAQTLHRARPGTPGALLAENAFVITLNPESPNGHTLFADSPNNGPCAKALVTELIPALESKYPLTASPEARVLRGHSSGGWSAIWLAVTQPETFGAAWASSPDPVDFRRFQLVDIYSQDNMYVVSAGTEGAKPPEPRFLAAGALQRQSEGSLPAIASFRSGGQARMTIRQENAMEEILGAGNTSAQQWDSWQAVFGPRGEDNRPVSLYDPAGGEINHGVAESYRVFDIGEKLRHDPASIGKIFRERIRVTCGELDSFFLNEAVTLFKEDLDRLVPSADHPGPGYVKLVPRTDHSTVFMSAEVRRIPDEMLEHFRGAALAPAR